MAVITSEQSVVTFYIYFSGCDWCFFCLCGIIDAIVIAYRMLKDAMQHLVGMRLAFVDRQIDHDHDQIQIGESTRCGNLAQRSRARIDIYVGFIYSYSL